MKFFSNQKFDKAGKLGVRLQKFLIFMAVCDIVLAIFGLPYSLISLTFNLTILAIGFFGALKRNKCLLLTYMIIRIAGICLNLLALIVAVGALIFVGVYFDVLYEQGYFDYYLEQAADQYSYEDIQLTIEAILGVSIIFVGITLACYAIYFAVVLYTVIVAGKMRSKLNRAEIIAEVTAGLTNSAKDIELQQVQMPASGPQYVIAPQMPQQAYPAPMYLQPVDPSAFKVVAE